MGPQTTPLAPHGMVFLSYFNFTYRTIFICLTFCLHHFFCMCSCSERGVLVLVQKKDPICRSHGYSGTQATPRKSLVGQSIGKKCTLTFIYHQYLNMPCTILLRSKTCVSASVSQYLDKIYGDKFGTSLNHEPPSDQMWLNDILKSCSQ